MTIRAGKMEDVTEIMDIIKEAVKHMETREIYQWDDIYPNEKIIIDDINENTLYVFVNQIDIIQGLIVLNEYQDAAYETVEWKYNSGRQLIIHRLCVHPNDQGKGIARMLIKFAEDFGAEQKYESIRLDAFIPNIRACRMYEQAGYEKRGIVTFRKGDFYCYEKGLLK